jgi:hypothetical protein
LGAIDDSEVGILMSLETYVILCLWGIKKWQ